EYEVVEAEARAEAAQARLFRLREAAEGGRADAARGVEPTTSIRGRLRLPRRPGRPGWLRGPGRNVVAAGVGVVLACASLGASGYMVWRHYTAVHNRQLAPQVTTGGRQEVHMF